jgi:hypothetical protein
MPRYFFHFVSAKRVVTDIEGVDLARLRAAHAHSLRLLRQMRIELPNADDRQIEISDETGKTPIVVRSRLPFLKVV